MIKEEMLESLCHLASDFSPEYMKLLDTVCLELFYNIFACFDAEWLSEEANSGFELIMKK
jgi:hypothetical protein